MTAANDEPKAVRDARREFRQDGLPFDERLLGPDYEPLLTYALENKEVAPKDLVSFIDANRPQLEERRRAYEKAVQRARVYDEDEDVAPRRSTDSKPKPSSKLRNDEAEDEPITKDNYWSRLVDGTPKPNQRKQRGTRQRRGKAPREAKQHPANHHIASLLPDRTLIERLEGYGDAVTLAWNTALERTVDLHSKTKEFGTLGELYSHVMANCPPCRAAPSDAIEAVCWEVVRSIQNYHVKRQGANAVPFPTRRRWQPSGRYFCVKRVVVDHRQSRIRIPKLGWVSYVGVLPAKPVKRATVKQTGAQWVVIVKSAHQQPDAVGIDVPVLRFDTGPGFS